MKHHLMIIFSFVGLLIITSCAKIQYLWEQGNGQAKILYRAEDNQKLLNDSTIKEEYKTKIRQIELYKQFFYQYFERPVGKIYSRTSILETKAVLVLVVASRFYEIEPLKISFPFMGEFPYLGFYELSSAEAYEQELKKEDYVTFKRPVYAYSSLSHFDDPILSSFFVYDDEELAELIFHELFHGIFFVKGEVDLNENLANYFGKEMTYLYYHYSGNKRQQKEQLLQKLSKLNNFAVNEMQDLKEEFSRQPPANKESAEKKIRFFLEKKFYPAVKNKCQQLQLLDHQCSYLLKDWNNASMAAFLTYEKHALEVAELRGRKTLSLKEFLIFLEKEYEKFKTDGKSQNFTEYLLKKNESSRG